MLTIRGRLITPCSGVHVCWSEHSDSSFVYGFMILNYGFGTMTATTFHHSADNKFVSFGKIEPFYGIFENGVLLMNMLEGVKVANCITAYEESQYYRDSDFLSVMYSLFPKATFYIFI